MLSPKPTGSRAPAVVVLVVVVVIVVGGDDGRVGAEVLLVV